MKRTQLTDACRNVRKELVAFLSIVVIGMLAAVAYLSIAYASLTAAGSGTSRSAPPC